MKLGLLLLVLTAIIVYCGAKVIYYMRKSEQQWEQVDRSKLKKWEDDDE